MNLITCSNLTHLSENNMKSSVNHNENYSTSNYNISTFSNKNSPVNFKPLVLSIQSQSGTGKSSVTDNTSNKFKPANQYKIINNSYATQGPNTNEYFCHGDNMNQRSNCEYNSHSEHLDIIDNLSGSYDYSTEEQRFCGGYGEWGHVINHTERSILADLKSYLFPDDIKNQADVIYNKMRYQVRRGKIRFQMLFFCVYCAHLELGRDVNPIQLGAQFDLTQGEVQRCDSLFSPLQTGYKPPSTSASPLSYLPDYCNNMNLSQEAIDDITRMASNILRKDITLYQENPQTVAAGLLRYYTITNGITTDDPQKITRVTNRSTVTIDSMFRRISTIDNS